MTTQRPELEDGQKNEPARREIDVYDKALRSSDVDEFLESEDLGLGYYDDAERWQQVESYRHGMFGSEAFGERILDRAVEETKRQLAVKGANFYDAEANAPAALTGWTELDDDEKKRLREKERIDKRRYIQQEGEKVWKLMNDNQRIEALEIATGIDRAWTPPHWRMLVARHETSRSRGARLLDNVFGRKSVQEVFRHESKDSGGGLLSSGDSR